MFSFYHIFHLLSLRQKVIVGILVGSVVFGILGICLTQFIWIFSLMGGCLSYIVLMVVTLYSIRTKIMQKIAEADTEEKLLKYASKYDDMAEQEILQDSKDTALQHDATKGPKESQNHQPNIKEKYKKQLKFLDISKASLGFELSFSLPRIFVFLGMILCFVILVWFGVFFPFVYLFGVFLGVILVVCALLIVEWHNEYTKNNKSKNI